MAKERSIAEERAAHHRITDVSAPAGGGIGWKRFATGLAAGRRRPPHPPMSVLM